MGTEKDQNRPKSTTGSTKGGDASELSRGKKPAPSPAAHAPAPAPAPSRGVINLRADGKKVRRVKKSVETPLGNQVETVITRADGRKVIRRIRKSSTTGTSQPTKTVPSTKTELPNSVHNKHWEETSRLLKEDPPLARQELSKADFPILWSYAPVDVILLLLKAWPESYKEEGEYGRTLVQTKIRHKQWDFLKILIEEFPHIVMAEDVIGACQDKLLALDVLELMLDQHPNVLLGKPDIIFRWIYQYKLEHFRAVLGRCPAATELKEKGTNLTPILMAFQDEALVNTEWISPILGASADVAKHKDYDGKSPLHLAYQHGASSEIVEMLLNAYPGAESERDNLGRTPKELTSGHSEVTAFTAVDDALLLTDYDIVRHGENQTKNVYPINAVVLCRGDILLRDPRIAQIRDDKFLHVDYSKQLLTRHRIFDTLLDEFSKLVGIDDKDVIQKAAAVQALAVGHLSHQNDTVVDFGLFDNPGYWCQQEILKLVMRIYQEGQFDASSSNPSISKDADRCLTHLERRNNGGSPPQPGDVHVKAFQDLTAWLLKGLSDKSHTFQGPVLKPLQSLFNKLFIRRGQTTVHVVGDMVRATLFVDDRETLRQIVSYVQMTFPNITVEQFRHPDTCDGLVDFLTYVNDNLKYVPDSHVLPYRFKMNSSQKKKKKEEPLWFNLNFFRQIPEYHRVGQSEMFVACELQIALTQEISKYRASHVAYERDRILSNQSLLKNYDIARKRVMSDDAQSLEQENDIGRLRLRDCSDDDKTLIEKVLYGRIATEVLIPCDGADDDDESNIAFESGPPSILTGGQILAGSFVRPERYCINNRSLNWHTSVQTANAIVVAGPYKLDGKKKYFVESFRINGMKGIHGTIGLYAHVGPYLIQIACGKKSRLNDAKAAIAIVDRGRNFTYLEQVCPVPVGTTALEVIVYGHFDNKLFGYEKIELSLTMFDVLQ